MNAEKKEVARHERGFSLVEVLIALAITLVVLGAAFGVFKAIMDSSSTASQVYEVTNDIQATLNLVRRDLYSAAAGPERGMQLPVNNAVNNTWRGSCLGVGCTFDSGSNSFTINTPNGIPLIGTPNTGRGGAAGGFVLDAVTPMTVNNNDAVTIFSFGSDTNIPIRITGNGTTVHFTGPDGRPSTIRGGDMLFVQNSAGESVMLRITCANDNPNAACGFDPGGINPTMDELDAFFGGNNSDAQLMNMRRITYYLEADPARGPTWLVRQVNNNPAQRVIPEVTRFNLTYSTIEYDSATGTALNLESGRNKAFFTAAPARVMDIRMVHVDINNGSETPIMGNMLLSNVSGGIQAAGMMVRRASAPPPRGVGGISTTTLITTGAALTEDGEVVMWGFRNSGQQGNGVRAYTDSDKPAKVRSLSNITALSGGAYHMLALDADGNVWGWGQSGYGETGCAPNTGIYVHTPCRVEMPNPVVFIGAGEYCSIALDDQGNVWTWGRNIYGQLGNDSTSDTRTPQRVNLNGERARLVGAAYEGAFAVTESGNIYGWGDNEASGLGISGGTIYGVQQIIRSPTIVVDSLKVYANLIVQISGGNGWGTALLDDGRVIGWGMRASLGQGMSSTSSSSPEPVPILSNVSQLFSRYVGSLALTNDGKLFTWGQTAGSAFGEIYGFVSPTERLPANPSVHGPVVDIGGAKENIYYRTRDGKLWGVGYNDIYKLDISCYGNATLSTCYPVNSEGSPTYNNNGRINGTATRSSDRPWRSWPGSEIRIPWDEL